MSWWFVAIMFVLAFPALAAWWFVPKYQISRLESSIEDPKDRADVEDNFRKTIGQLIGGAAVLLGAGLAYHQTQQTLQAQDVQSNRTLSAQEQQSKRTIASQQVSSGFLLLSEGSSVKRLGGIYMLEGVMNTSDLYNVSVLEALCAFVRDNTSRNAGGDENALETAIQAALTVVKRRPAGPGKCVLAGAHIPKAVLNDANLRGADLTGTYLNGAILTGAVLLDGASLYGATLNAADLNFAKLQGAILIRANMDRAQLIGADLTDATLSSANLSNVNLNGANLHNADLRACLRRGFRRDEKSESWVVAQQDDARCRNAAAAPIRLI